MRLGSTWPGIFSLLEAPALSSLLRLIPIPPTTVPLQPYTPQTWHLVLLISLFLLSPFRVTVFIVAHFFALTVLPTVSYCFYL